MTKNQRRQFYNRLRKIKSKYRWIIDHGYIRTKNSVTSFCPLTAICKDVTGNIYPSHHADDPKVDVGIPLSVKDREIIMVAADLDMRRLETLEEKYLRKTMMRILGLK